MLTLLLSIGGLLLLLCMVLRDCSCQRLDAKPSASSSGDPEPEDPNL
jgi:hypothetical protein